MRSVENEECRKCGVWKMRSVENAECGKCGVKKKKSIFHFNFPFQCGKRGVCNMESNKRSLILLYSR